MKELLKSDLDLLAPSAAPGNVQGSSTSSSSIRVTWANVTCLHRNGIILSYRVSYQAVGGSFTVSTKRDKDVAGASNQVDLTNLEANVNYSITVTASTSAGEGPSSIAMVVETAEAGETLSFGLFWYLCLLVSVFKKQQVKGYWIWFGLSCNEREMSLFIGYHLKRKIKLRV